MIVLQPDQVCPFASKCKYHDMLNQCSGAKTRPTTFTCDYADEQGNIREGVMRNSLDKNGKMQFIQEWKWRKDE